MKLVNLTPHAINLVNDAIDDGTVTIKPSGTIARVAVTRQQIGTIDLCDVIFPINQNVFGDVTDLPDPQTDTLYIVSAIVANACPNRTDLVIVDNAVRNDAGQIIGARALARV
jgi:hypothetical protein